MVECPADGCSYTGPKSSVLGHYSGKPDEAHPGGYARARELLADADDDFSAGDAANFDSDDPADDSAGSTSAQNPIMGDANPDDTTTETVELPCGHEDYDPSEAPDKPHRVGCEQCGETWRVTP